MLFVGIGGIFGAISRFLLGKWIAGKTASRYPLGTWFINVSGSFLMGLLAALHGDHSIPEWVWLLLGTGFLGAYTTFSTFGYETLQLMQQKETRAAAIYVFFSVVLGLLFAWLGSLAGAL